MPVRHGPKNKEELSKGVGKGEGGSCQGVSGSEIEWFLRSGSTLSMVMHDGRMPPWAAGMGCHPQRECPSARGSCHSGTSSRGESAGHSGHVSQPSLL